MTERRPTTATRATPSTKARKPVVTLDDLQASGAQVEAEEVDTQTFRWRDRHDVEIPASADDWDGDALEFFETGRVASGIKMLIGAGRYDEIKKAERAATGRWLTKDVAELGDAIAKAAGFVGVGE